LESVRVKPEFWPLFEAVLRNVGAVNYTEHELAEQKRTADQGHLKDQLIRAMVTGRAEVIGYKMAIGERGTGLARGPRTKKLRIMTTFFEAKLTNEFELASPGGFEPPFSP
jgi:hypothetical protein